jgi:hypothetical protein
VLSVNVPVSSQSNSVSSFTLRILILSGIVVLGILSRLLPHPPNFSPIGALMLFCGATFLDRRYALLLPLVTLFFSDLALGLHELIPVVYGCFLINVLLGRWVRNRKSILNVGAITLLGSVQFFVITNLAVWLFADLHGEQTLLQCYTAAIPFFQNSLIADLAFSVVLFAGVPLVERGIGRIAKVESQKNEV